MAYTQSTFFAASGVYNATSYGEAPAIHTYRTEDLLADIMSGYFPDFFGFEPEEVRVNDILALVTGDLRLFAFITSVAPVGLIAFSDFPPNLVTEALTTQSNEYTGIWSSNIPVLLDFVQQGHECLMTFPSGFDTSSGGAFIEFFSPVVVGSFPLFEVIKPMEVMNNSISEMGHMVLQTDGNVKIFRLDAVPFSVGGTAGFPAQSVVFRTV